MDFIKNFWLFDIFITFVAMFNLKMIKYVDFHFTGWNCL